MKIIKKEADYAVRALLFIAAKNERVPASAVYSSVKAPRSFMRKILQVLSREKVLVSEKGRAGGFRLARKPEETSLLTVVEAFGGRKSRGGCPFDGRACGNYGFCGLRGKLGEIEERIFEKLGKTSLKNLLRREDEKKKDYKDN